LEQIIIDTAVWIWLTLEKSSQLSAKASKAIKQAKTINLSVISCWELAKLVEKKRIGFSIPTREWIRRSLDEFHIDLVDLTPEICVESTELATFHSDPADQLIVSTARILGAPLVTPDKKILAYRGIEGIW
jgi:PIN domain nuclease of toxin-antitoxin system